MLLPRPARTARKASELGSVPARASRLPGMLAARYKLPAVYTSRTMVIGGGLICYGPDIADQFRQAAGYGRWHSQG